MGLARELPRPLQVASAGGLSRMCPDRPAAADASAMAEGEAVGRMEGGNMGEPVADAIR